MPWLKMPDGTNVHVKMAKPRRAKCDECRDRPHDFLCDYPTGEGQTCDRRICRLCVTKIGPRDFCTHHVHVSHLDFDRDAKV